MAKWAIVLFAVVSMIGCKFEFATGECVQGETVTACEWKEGKKITCPEGEVISVEKAMYGRQDAETCASSIQTRVDCAAAKALEKTREICQDKTSCLLTAANEIYTDPCPGVGKYLQVTYSCKSKRQCGCQDEINVLTAMVMKISGGWYRAENGLWYFLEKRNMVFSAAKTNCEEQGGRLVTAGWRDEEIREELKAKFLTSGGRVWIGLERYSEKKWKWVDGEDADTGSTMWSPGEPSGGSEECGETSNLWGWMVNDVPCDQQFQSLCEWPARAQ